LHYQNIAEPEYLTMTYPIVIPLSHCGGKLKDDTELRFALRSITAHFKDEFKIVIVGKHVPAWLTGAEHVYSGEGLKTALIDAARAYPDGFFWWYDDLTLLRDSTGEELKITPAMKGWIPPKSGWSNSLEKIHKRLVAEGLPAHDYSRPHGPYWFDKSMVDEGFRDWPGMKSKFPWESWILSKRDWPRRYGVVKQYYGKFGSAPGDHSFFLNYSDGGNTPELRTWLEQRFPDASRFEADTDAKVRAAKVRFRIKGETDGPVYQGQEIVKQCGKCNGSSRSFKTKGNRLAVSFCLFGGKPHYLSGSIENANLCKIIYPEWDVVFHVEKGHAGIPKLRELGVMVVEHDAEPGLCGTHWRFETMGMSDLFDRVICRDVDSWVSWRDRAAVDEWIAKDTSLHTMWDYKRKRNRHISAGMFGVKTCAMDFKEAVASWEKTGKYGDDENFLAAKLWPILSESSTRHRGRNGNRFELPFPPHRPVSHHVGARAPVNGNPFIEGTTLSRAGVFSEIYQANRWKSKETRSGPGSTMAQTRILSHALPPVLRCLGVTSVLDVACGDVNWMPFRMLQGIKYIGADIVADMVAANQRKHPADDVSFIQLDVVEEVPPMVDAIFCRDCFVHLSLADISRALKHLKASGSSYLLTTTFPGNPALPDIKIGGWRPINLERAPFNFPAPIAVINEGCTEGGGKFSNKSIGIWRLSEIQSELIDPLVGNGMAAAVNSLK
jgi:SAM-dependent methyltransferase